MPPQSATDSIKSQFRFRLTTATRLPGLLRLEAKDTSIALPDGHTVHVVSRNGESLATASKFHFESGFYESEQEARKAGEHLRLCLRLLNAGLALGMNIPLDDHVSGSLAQAVKDKAKSEHGAEVMDNVWGIMIFPDDEQHIEFTMHGELDVSPSDTEYWLSGLPQLWESTFTLDESSEEAVELLALAALEQSPRSAFLVTYLALEQLVPTRKRSGRALALLKRLEKWVVKAALRKHRPISAPEKEALLGSLGRLHHESTGNALIRFAEANKGRKVEGVAIKQFIKNCIATRHITAHPGKSRTQPNYVSLSKGLRHIAACLLWSKNAIPNLQIKTPASSISFQRGGMQARVITYERR